MDGVKLHQLRRITVPNGDILHALKLSDEDYYGFGEAYFSHIKHGSIKGWKRHNKVTLNLVVVLGSVKFIFYDDREDSSTFGMFEEFQLSPDNNYQRLTVSPGVWMSFMGISDEESIIMNIINDVHNPDEANRKDLSEIPYFF
jgi:dTDP-4-dehydrorhamnose 3,5-epimerase